MTQIGQINADFLDNMMNDGINMMIEESLYFPLNPIILQIQAQMFR